MVGQNSDVPPVLQELELAEVEHSVPQQPDARSNLTGVINGSD